MLYRDYMQKFRPLLGPDGVGGGEGDGSSASAPAAAPAADAAPAATAQAAAAPAVVDGSAAAAPALTDGAPAAAVPAAPESKPSLLEAATGKPADGEAAKVPEKEAPAPAAADKTDAEKAAAAAGDTPKTDAEKQAEADAAAATDPATKEATAESPPPAPIKYEAFNLPDTIKLDDKKLAEFTEIAGAAQVKQEDAQKFVDLYVSEAERLAQELRAEQRRTWDVLNDTWKDGTRKDPEIGGNRLETSLSMAKAVVEEFLTADEAREYFAHTSNNGMGNFHIQIKLLERLGRKLNIFEDGIVPANAQAPKAQKGPGNRGWYKDTPGAAS